MLGAVASAAPSKHATAKKILEIGNIAWCGEVQVRWRRRQLVVLFVFTATSIFDDCRAVHIPPCLRAMSAAAAAATAAAAVTRRVT